MLVDPLGRVSALALAEQRPAVRQSRPVAVGHQSLPRPATGDVGVVGGPPDRQRLPRAGARYVGAVVDASEGTGAPAAVYPAHASRASRSSAHPITGP
jgi:hypothetical protein